MMLGYLIPLCVHWNTYSASRLDFLLNFAIVHYVIFFLVHFLELQILIEFHDNKSFKVLHPYELKEIAPWPTKVFYIWPYKFPFSYLCIQKSHIYSARETAKISYSTTKSLFSQQKLCNANYLNAFQILLLILWN